MERDMTSSWREFLADERGSHLVETILLTAIIVLGTGVVMLRLREAVGEMFMQLFARYLGRK
jgi:hypothetical protein